MPEPVTGFLATAYGVVASIWGYVKWPAQQVVAAYRLNAKVAALEETVKRLSELPAPPSPYRKCGACGERDLRLIDKYRYRPDVFDDQRYYHEKWRCYSCGNLDEVNLPEPGG